MGAGTIGLAGSSCSKPRGLMSRTSKGLLRAGILDVFRCRGSLLAIAKNGRNDRGDLIKREIKSQRQKDTTNNELKNFAGQCTAEF
jgi:hypothetical protein